MYSSRFKTIQDCLPPVQVHVRLGVSPPPGIILTIHGLPPQFLLATAYIETLLTEKFGCGVKSCGDRRGGLELLTRLGLDTPVFEDTEYPPSMWSVDNIEITAPVLVQVMLGPLVVVTICGHGCCGVGVSHKPETNKIILNGSSQALPHPQTPCPLAMPPLCESMLRWPDAVDKT